VVRRKKLKSKSTKLITITPFEENPAVTLVLQIANFAKCKPLASITALKLYDRKLNNKKIHEN